MKALLYEWSESSGCLYRTDIRAAFRDCGINFDGFYFDFGRQSPDEWESFFAQIQTDTYDFCFSINYFPELSNMCMKYHLKYIAWGYDCPFNVIDIEKTLGNPCNYVFCFDRIQAERYVKMGFDTVYHLPLGINAKRYQNISASAKQKAQYQGDISFVGSLYEGYYSAIAEVCGEYHRGYLEGVINAQQLLYGAYLLEDVITQPLVDSINAHFKELQPDTLFQLSKEQLVHVLDQETSRRERILLLNLLGRRYDTHLYSYQKYDMLQGIVCHDRVDYFTEMPQVFASSRINLNISVKGIQSGIPLRALDIMASGGFLLSNYQAELVEYFRYGEDMVVYESMEDAVAKCQYYLEHEDARKQIAERGRKRVFAEHNMADKINCMLEVAGVI